MSIKMFTCTCPTTICYTLLNHFDNLKVFMLQANLHIQVFGIYILKTKSMSYYSCQIYHSTFLVDLYFLVNMELLV